MKPYRIAGVAAFAVLTLWTNHAEAAWNNVFQVTCFGCRRRPTTAQYFAAPVVASAAPSACCAPPQPTSCCAPPAPTCTTRYVQRSYYQPVTVMQTQTHYEPVTTYRTSYYYEPVTSYRYSCYYDPCSCTTQQVATPCTSYQLRSQSCPVQSWVQRCSQVPVTSYQKSFYWEPQTTCCSTTNGAPIAAPAPCCNGQQQQQAPVYASPAPQQQQPPPPVIDQQRQGTPPPPQIQEQKSGQTGYDRYYPPEPPMQPQGMRQQLPQGQVPVKTVPQPAAPPVKMDRIVSNWQTQVEGTVVRTDRAPRAGAKVLFISAQRQANQKEVTANDAGRFNAELPGGDWLVYVTGPDGLHVYHSRIEVTERGRTPLTLVSR